ncbi:MAG: DUF2203 domain-containing protein [Thermoleophilia bacterium]|nr:DUF2203 domain-containing protein [Thermoleophilia bacterium]
MRLFTPAEANDLLVEVRPLAERVVERKRALDAAEAERSRLLRRIAGNGGDLTPSDVTEAVQRVEREAAALGVLVDELQGRGVQVKDLDLGLLDFPSEREGEVVLLCWRVGEEEIAYWHGLDEGYAGRKPL